MFHDEGATIRWVRKNGRWCAALGRSCRRAHWVYTVSYAIVNEHKRAVKLNLRTPLRLEGGAVSTA